MVRATSADGSFSTQAFTVDLTDVDEFDVGAISDTNAAANSVAENAAIGTLVGITASASDADATTNAITYTPGQRRRRALRDQREQRGGDRRRRAGPGSAASHDIVVRATSADGSFSTQGFTINVADVDEFDVGAISDADAAANSVAENAAVGHAGRHHGLGERCGRDHQHDHLHPGQRRRRALRDQCEQWGGDRSRGAGSGSRGEPRHRGAGDLGRRQLQHPGLHHQPSPTWTSSTWARSATRTRRPTA